MISTLSIDIAVGYRTKLQSQSLVRVVVQFPFELFVPIGT